MSEEDYMTEEENIMFYELLEKLVKSDDMANMNIINKAIELKELIDEL
jgi:ABC-type Na+ transport system ATPase subunit NatA